MSHGVVIDPELKALGALTSAADALPYFTGSGTAATTTMTAFARSILDDADEATFKATVNLEPGTDVQAYSAQLDAFAALDDTDGNFIVGTGSTFAVESGATARTSLGVAIGTDVQAYDLNLDQLAALTPTDSNIIVGSGSAWVAESGSTARDSLGLGQSDNVQFTGGTFTGDVLMTGNLTVNGDTITANTETVLVADNFMALNAAYTTLAQQAAGWVATLEPQVVQVVAGGAFTATTVEVANSTGYAAGDIIEVSNPNDPDNAGYFEVQSQAAGVITVDPTPTCNFTKGSFTADATVQGTVSKVEIGAVRFSDDATPVLQTATGNSCPLTWNNIAAGVSLSSNNTWTGTNTFQDTVTTEGLRRDVAIETTAATSVTLDGEDHVYIVDRAAGTAYTVNLPAATGTGQEYIVKRMPGDASASVTVDASGAELIDEVITFALAAGEAITIIDIASGEWAIV